MTLRVVLGNRDAIESRDNGESFERLPDGKRATEVVFPEGTSLLEAFSIVTAQQGVWESHVDTSELDDDEQPIVPKPAWVAVDKEHETLGRMLAEQYGGIEVRELLDPYDVETPSVKTRVLVKALQSQLLLSCVLMLIGLQLALKTNAGNDFQAAQMGGSASATAVAKWVALTANNTAPAAGDTTLTGEITTGGGGLIRKAGTYAHTTGAANYTITTVFTANGSDSLPVTIAKRGIFDAASAGALVFSTLVSPTATLSASGDQLTLTDTISL